MPSTPPPVARPHRVASIDLRLAWITALLALAVVMVGAYVRLSHAGLGCPDWPGCYGEWRVPGADAASARFPDTPLETAKAWKEMVHRYLAGTLALLIFVMAWRALRQPGGLGGCHRRLPVALAVLVVGQALLGMWTVTWRLQPLVVTGHLLGGMATLGLLAWLVLDLSEWRRGGVPRPGVRRFAGIALGVLALQIALGGWTSANYAFFACPDFPTCQGRWWPESDFAGGFTLWRQLGVNYEGGVLDFPARTAVHLAHRLGALVTALTLLALAATLWRMAADPPLRRLGLFLALLVLAQFTLGVTIAVQALPLPAAVTHNGLAALLLVTLVAAIRRVSRREGG